MVTKQSIFQSILTVLTAIIVVSCGSDPEQQTEQPETESTMQGAADRVATIEEGLAGPEAIRYDAGQDVYFISNFNGQSSAADSNGYIARAQPDGTIDSLKFMTSTEEGPLHAPRGMYITGDTLYVADLKGVHAFNTQTGSHINFFDFTSFEPGFLNDIAVGPNGKIYVTDTGQSRVYEIDGSEISIAIDSLESPPNGITWDEQKGKFLIAPWNSGEKFQAFMPDSIYAQDFITTSSGGNFDGIEPFDGAYLVSSQNDSSLYLIRDSQDHKAVIKTAPEPADIALDTKRSRVAVPYINLNRVDIWQLNE
ncbi:SMP-30/gluconolactonase/LRE family protein [Fodinibius salsisoli]|uniref:SMP-30/gluconolactonase/LRE family protein n=1 Tax=Fodinibius salsisoli TaxID=2820877 RepID=A0ABT3PS30_9BACT|nr:SMP-30/gluconolactonase/LRE family protein [Fodinibius salsisoli]MCW9708669.1 SMP-30/gluconolactonase/LRE family protein [Fodinibius salsisoli]